MFLGVPAIGIDHESSMMTTGYGVLQGRLGMSDLVRHRRLPSRGVLRHMRRDVHRHTGIDELLRVVALAGAQRDFALVLAQCLSGVADHGLGRLVFGETIGLGDHGVGDQAVTVIAQGVAHVAAHWRCCPCGTAGRRHRSSIHACRCCAADL